MSRLVLAHFNFHFQSSECPTLLPCSVQDLKESSPDGVSDDKNTGFTDRDRSATPAGEAGFK